MSDQADRFVTTVAALNEENRAALGALIARLLTRRSLAERAENPTARPMTTEERTRQKARLSVRRAG